MAGLGGGVPGFVLISGFTHPDNEFTTPCRVVNWHACNGCWNDPTVRFDHKNLFGARDMRAPRGTSSARA